MSEPPPRFAQFFPLPLVAVVVLLLILIFVTPNLLSLGKPAAGSLASAAELILDHSPTSGATWIYLSSLGEVRFSSLEVRLSSQVPWPAPSSDAGVNWTNSTVEFDVLSLSVSTFANPVALSVQTVYVDASGTSVESVGVYELNVTSGHLVVASLYAGEPNIPSTSLDSLPVTVLLESVPMGAST